jgi:hypothetical protein
LGVDADRYEVLAKELGGFYVSMTLLQKDINARWECLVVYGPAQHRESELFLRDVDVKLCQACCPIMIAGDFNLIRSTEDKNNANIDIGLMSPFNDFIAYHHLKELRRHGSRFTWTNKQQVPVMCVLDRVLVSTEWEMLFPMAVIQVETRIGSDHSPLLVSDGSQNRRKSNRFYLERQWFGHSDFKMFVATKCCNAIISYRGDGTALDCWNCCIRALRKALRGWGANKSTDLWRKKTALLTEIASLDKRADDIGLSVALWQ